MFWNASQRGGYRPNSVKCRFYTINRLFGVFKCNFTHSIIERIQIWFIYGQQLRVLEKVGGTNFWLQKPRYREVRVIERRVIERSDCTKNTKY